MQGPTTPEKFEMKNHMFFMIWWLSLEVFGSVSFFAFGEKGIVWYDVYSVDFLRSTTFCSWSRAGSSARFLSVPERFQMPLAGLESHRLCKPKCEQNSDMSSEDSNLLPLHRLELPNSASPDESATLF